MPSEYYLVKTCDECGKLIRHLCLDASNDIPEIRMEFLGNEDFYCEDCEKSHCYGEIDYVSM